MGTVSEGGEFTENGYTDSRFNEPGNTIVPVEVNKNNKDHNKEDEYKKEAKAGSKKMNKGGMAAIIIAISIFVFLGGFGHLGFFGEVISLVFFLALITFRFLVSGLMSLLIGFRFLLISGGSAAMFLAYSAMTIGLGLLCLVLSILFYGKFIPFLYRKIKYLIAKGDKK